jgi:hypothetical protein
MARRGGARIGVGTGSGSALRPAVNSSSADPIAGMCIFQFINMYRIVYMQIVSSFISNGVYANFGISEIL